MKGLIVVSIILLIVIRLMAAFFNGYFCSKNVLDFYCGVGEEGLKRNDDDDPPPSHYHYSSILVIEFLVRSLFLSYPISATPLSI